MKSNRDYIPILSQPRSAAYGFLGFGFGLGSTGHLINPQKNCVPRSFFMEEIKGKTCSIQFRYVNPLTPTRNSDQHQISPGNISAYSTPEVMRIMEMISQGEIS